MSATTTPAPQRIPLVALLTSHGTVHSSVLLFMVALPWFVLETTGSAAQTGLAIAVHGVPMVITGIFGGVIVDRLGFRRTLIIADLGSAIAFGLIPVLYLTVGITFWQLLLLVFTGAIFDTPSFTSRLSIMPDVARRAGVRLERANSVSQTLSQSAILLAPALGGILIGFIGSAAVLFVTTGLLLVSVSVVLVFVPREASTAQTSVAPGHQYLDELKRGISFLLSTKLILVLLGASVMVQFGRANLMIVMPVYVQEYFDSASDFGFMFAALGGGGLVSAILYGIWGHRWPQRPVVLVGASSMLLAFVLLALTPPYWLIIVGLSLVGFLAGPMIPLIFTKMQEMTPANLRGRVFGLYDASIFGAMVPGRLLAGYMIEWTSIVSTLVIVGSGYLVALAAITTNRGLHQIGRDESGNREGDHPVPQAAEQPTQEAGK